MRIFSRNMHSISPLAAALVFTSVTECSIPQLPESGVDTSADDDSFDPEPGEDGSTSGDSAETDSGSLPDENPVHPSVDREQDCMMLTGGACDGFPGTQTLGSERGNILANFVTKTCYDDPFEFAQEFELTESGIPKNKSILLLLGQHKCAPCLSSLSSLPEYAQELEQYGTSSLAILVANNANLDPSSPALCQEVWLKHLNRSKLGTNHRVKALSNPSGTLTFSLSITDTNSPQVYLIDYNGVVRYAGTKLKSSALEAEADRISDEYDAVFGSE